MNRLLVTGLGVVAPTGVGIEAHWSSLVCGEPAKATTSLACAGGGWTVSTEKSTAAEAAACQRYICDMNEPCEEYPRSSRPPLACTVPGR